MSDALIRSKEEAIQEMAAIEGRAKDNNGKVSLSDSIRYHWLAQVAATYVLEECKAKARTLKSEGVKAHE